MTNFACAESNANDELGVLNKGLCQFTLHWVREKREMFETTRCIYEHASLKTGSFTRLTRGYRITLPT